jgi:hypothetical protein
MGGMRSLGADAVLLGHLWHGPLVRLAEDGHHLLFAESRFSSWLPRVSEGAILSGFTWSEKRRAGQTSGRVPQTSNRTPFHQSNNAEIALSRPVRKKAENSNSNASE